MSRVTTLAEIAPLLENTILQDSKVIVLEIPESGEQGFAVETTPENRIEV